MHSFEVESNRSKPADSALTQQLLPTATQDKTSTPIDLVFKNVTYQVKVPIKGQTPKLFSSKKTEQKVILDDVSGIAKGGEVTAILGASGAGKTTLFNAISCRIKKTSGTLLANSVEYDYEMFGDFANYVMQADVLFGTLTVKETLMFAATLKLPIS